MALINHMTTIAHPAPLIAAPTALDSMLRPADDTKVGAWITPDGAGHAAAFVHRPGYDAYKHTSVRQFINGVPVPMDPPPMSPLTPTMGGTMAPMLSAFPAPMSPLHHHPALASHAPTPRLMFDSTMAAVSPSPQIGYPTFSAGATMNTPHSSMSSWNSGSFNRRYL